MAEETTKGLRKFRAWVDGLGDNAKVKAAASLGCTEQTIKNILAGKGPSLETAVLIEKRAKIPAAAWVS